MFMYETYEYAPNWMKKFAGKEFKVFAYIRVYPGIDETKYPNLRDREQDVLKMLNGFAPGAGTIIREEVKGYKLYECGWDIAGGQLVQDFKVFIVL